MVLHDALCPMTPPDFVASCLERARETGRAVVGVRPVTDTVKVVRDGVVGETIDRDAVLAVASPLVLPAALAAVMDAPVHDLVAAVSALVGSGHEVETVPAPAAARRVSSADDVRLLEALTDPRG